MSLTEECGAEGPWREKVKEYFEKELSQQATLKRVIFILILSTLLTCMNKKIFIVSLISQLTLLYSVFIHPIVALAERDPPTPAASEPGSAVPGYGAGHVRQRVLPRRLPSPGRQRKDQAAGWTL